MKGIIKFLMWILIILLVLIAASYFLPQTARVTRTTTINAKPKIVFNQVNDFHNWDKWSVWHQDDTGMVKDYTNHGVGVNSQYSWESDKKGIGTGTMKILQAEPYHLIKSKINFDKGGEGVSQFLFDEINDSTMVTWDFSMDTKYNPVARWMGLFLDRTVGDKYEESLQNLKTVAEMQAQHKTFYIEIDTLEGFNYLSMRRLAPNDSISSAMGEMYGELYGFITRNNITIVDKPFCIYHTYNDFGADIEAGIPIDIEIMGNAKLLGGQIKDKRCVVLDYYGSYENMDSAYTAIKEWISKRKYKINGSPIERYMITMPEEQDPNKWLTKIYFPIE